MLPFNICKKYSIRCPSLEPWEIIGAIILLGPLALTSICLAITMIHTGIEELLRKAPDPAYRMEMDLKRYIEEVKELMRQQDSKTNR